MHGPNIDVVLLAIKVPAAEKGGMTRLKSMMKRRVWALSNKGREKTSLLYLSAKHSFYHSEHKMARPVVQPPHVR
jgi:hypothetical protein